jgi:predicted ATPase/DNA-binding SARP family transcriptional activator
MEFRILGPLEVVDDGHALPLGRGRQRALLGLLVLRANEVVSQDRLVDELWGERPPPTAPTALHGHVSRLRKLLGEGRLQTTPPGYLLRVAPEELDLYRFRRLVERGRHREALALWRGPALADLAFQSFAQAEIGRLEEARLAALERRIDVDLDAGRYGELVGELEVLTEAHPLRERFAAQLMLAHYRSGRQADALAAYRTTRATLVDRLGLEPSVALRTLERRILEHDPALDAGLPGSGRREGRSNLPAPTTSFIGRVRELAQVRSLLARADVRLLTLTGAGGTGKTRLALEAVREVADEFADGAWFVSLAAVADPNLVQSAIAGALGVQPSQGQSHADAVEYFVRERELVLVLDNLEHLLDAAVFAGKLLAMAPGLAIVATSRTHLNLYGEFEYVVPPLSVPILHDVAPLDSLTELDAIRLFVERARAVQPQFALDDATAAPVAYICTRLDGLPLAIELAAAQVRTLTIEELVARFDQRLELLIDGPRDVHARQRTLRDTIAWSYDLLTPVEQALFARLAVFAGGCSVAAAAEVCCRGLALDAGEGLDSLARKNLIRSEDDAAGGRRFVFLETIREFALDRLAARGDGQELRRRHARCFHRLGEDGGPNLGGDDRAAWLARLDLDLENIRAALAWSADGGDAEVGLQLVGSLLTFWIARGYFGEGAAVAEALLERSTMPTVGRARALLAAGMLGFFANGDVQNAGSRSAEAVELARRFGERWFLAVSLNLRGTTVRFDDHDAALRLYREALEVAGRGELWWPSMLVWANIGITALSQGKPADAVEALESATALARKAADQFWMPTMLSLLGRALTLGGELARSGQAQTEALDRYLELRNAWGTAAALEAFAELARAQGADADAARLLGAEDEVCRRAGLAHWVTTEASRQETVRCVEAALGAHALAAELDEGRGLTQDEIVALARSVAELESAPGT